MSCFYPLRAYKARGGGVTFDRREGDYAAGRIDSVSVLGLPCGRCTGCRIDQRREKTMRMMHEAKMHKESSFVTLTYDDAHLPSGGTLVPEDMKLFLMRLRSRIAPVRIRFAGVGEYGEALGRPHYHLAIFGYTFPDRYVWAKFSESGEVYRSPELEELWTLGTSSFGDLTRESAEYIAGYVHKKITGDLAEEHYGGRHPEFWRASNGGGASGVRGGLGVEWVRRYAGTDVWPHDRVVFNGRETRPPRYYDKVLRRELPERYAEVKQARVIRALESVSDNTPERLKVKEAVAKAGLESKQRRKLK